LIAFRIMGFRQDFIGQLKGSWIRASGAGSLIAMRHPWGDAGLHCSLAIGGMKAEVTTSGQA